MAELIEAINNNKKVNGSDGDNDNDTNSDEITEVKTKLTSGRRPKFTAAEDLIIVQEVYALEAHVAPHGETGSRFSAAAIKANENPNFKKKITGKSLQDRFKKLLSEFEVRDTADQNRSGTGGECSDLDMLLGYISQSMKDQKAATCRDANAKNEQEEKKLIAGQELILNSLQRRSKRNKSDDEEDGAEESDTPPKPKRRRLDDSDGLKSIGEAVKSSDHGRLLVETKKIELEKERLRIQQQHMEDDRADRVKQMELQRDMMKTITDQSNKQLESIMTLMHAFMNSKK